MTDWLLDLRQSLRAFARQKGFVMLAVAALAMGIGFTTIMFSIARGATRGLPFDDAHELVILTRTHAQNGWDDLAAKPFDFLAWSAQQKSFEELAAFSSDAVNLSIAGSPPERVTGASVTPNVFTLLGVTPVLGRGFEAADALPTAPPAVLLSHALWQARFSADRHIIGRVIRTNGHERTVIGVLPPEFGFPVNSALWLPLVITGSTQPGAGPDLRVLGRLRDNVNLTSARSEFSTIATRIAADRPQTHQDLGVRIFPYVELELDPEVTPVLFLMVLAASFVLLIACANVASMLLARAATRTREVAVRTALGATRRRIIAQHLTESLIIAGLAGALGLLIAFTGVRFFDTATASILDMFWLDFRVDLVVAAFAAVLVLVAGAAAGILPALRATRASVADVLKNQAHAASNLRVGRLSRVLVVGQITLACGLLVVAWLLIRGALNLHAREFPFGTRDVLTAQVSLTEETVLNRPAWNALVMQLTRLLQETPAVQSAAVVSALPGRGAGNWSFALDGARFERMQDMPSTGVVFVTPGFLDVLQSRVLRGRDLTWADDAGGARVALVNESFVARFSSDQDPLGRRIRLGTSEPLTIVGVVPDLMMEDVQDRRGDGIYAAALQNSPFGIRLLVRTGPDPLALTARIRDRVESVEPDLPLFEIASLHDAIYADKRILDAFGLLFSLFGVGALFLTATGLYGIVSFHVNQRTRELGIRKALGARRRDILAVVLMQGGRQLALGYVLGTLLAWGLARGLASALEFVNPNDPLVFGSVILVLLITGLAALLVPSRRAAGVEPVQALRHE